MLITESLAGVADATIPTGYVTVPRGKFVEVRRKFVPKPSAPTGSVVIDRSLPQADERPSAATPATSRKGRRMRIGYLPPPTPPGMYRKPSVNMVFNAVFFAAGGVGKSSGNG